jgi:hypothetical protein
MPNTAIIDTEQFAALIAAYITAERKALVDDLRAMLDERDAAALRRERHKRMGKLESDALYQKVIMGGLMEEPGHESLRESMEQDDLALRKVRAAMEAEDAAEDAQAAGRRPR